MGRTTHAPGGPRHAVVTGAAGFLGSALARALALRGIRLSLWDRDGPGLAALARALDPEESGTAVPQNVDVTDHGAFRAALKRAHDRAPVDMVALVAGLGGAAPPGAPLEDAGRTDALLAVNLAAPLEGARAALALPRQDDRPLRLVVVSSLAGRLGYPEAPVYAATRAGLSAFARSLAARHEGSGLEVTLATPGFLARPMGEGAAFRPLAVTAEAAAERIVRTALSGGGEVAVPRTMSAFLALLAALPPGARARLWRTAAGG